MSWGSTPRDSTDVETTADVFGALPEPDLDDGEVMASVEQSTSRPELIIADISRNDAWLSVDEADAPVLTEWC